MPIEPVRPMTIMPSAAIRRARAFAVSGLMPNQSSNDARALMDQHAEAIDRRQPARARGARANGVSSGR